MNTSRMTFIALLVLQSHCWAAAAPDSRGPAPISVAIVTVCGLAAVLVVEPQGGSAEIYYGRSMEERLTRLNQGGASIDQVELADVYVPVEASCESVLRSQSDLTQGDLPTP